MCGREHTPWLFEGELGLASEYFWQRRIMIHWSVTAQAEERTGKFPFTQVHTGTLTVGS